MEKVNVVCVNWGIKYSPEYVTRLYQMVKKNTTHDFQMFCLTDNPDIYPDEITGIKLKPGFEGWWNKMQLFRDDVLPAGQYLYFDLDVVIVDNIDCLFEFEGFSITRDFINPETGLLGGKEYNSSIMRFTQNNALWKHFQNNQSRWKAEQQRISYFGDQNVISDFLNKVGFDNPFPDDWIWSFKIGTLRGRRPVDHSNFFGAEIPESGKVCVFHGEPNPDQVDVGWVNENWKQLNSVNFSKNLDDKQTDTQKNDMLNITINKRASHTEIALGNVKFNAPNHWFWDEFAGSWEPQTVKFFKNNLVPGTDYLDIGAWVGPTAFIATALGAGKVKIIEPNPVNFFQLLATQINNNLLSKWFLVNACVSNKRGSAVIGPIKGIESSSSATNIRDQHQDGATIMSLKLSDLILEDDKFSLIKIDIEGAEDFIIEDLSILADKEAALWLSIHPPFIENKELFLEHLLSLGGSFYFVNEDNNIIENDVLKMWIMTKEEFPSWGTKWGNFFEIGLLPKTCFGSDGQRKTK